MQSGGAGPRHLTLRQPRRPPGNHNRIMRPAPDNRRQRLATYVRANPNILQTISAFAIKLLGAALSFGFSFLVARQLGASGTGSFAIAITTATVGSTIALLGLDYILLRTLAGDLRVGNIAGGRGAVRTVVAAVIVTGITIAAALAVFGGLLLAALIGPELDPGIARLAALLLVPLALNRTVSAALRGAGSVITAQWVDGPFAMALAVSGLLALILAGNVGGVDRVLALYIATTLTSTVVAWGLYARRTRTWAAAAKVPLRPMLGQSWRIALVVLSALLADWVVLLVLGSNFSTREVGQFRTAWQITSLIALIVVTFESVSGPRIAAAHRVGEHASIRKIWRQSAVIMTVMSAPLFVVTLGFPGWLLGQFGPDFTVAATALQILGVGQLINIVTGPIGAIMIMTGQERWSLRISMGALVLLAVLSLTLIPAYGLVGAALTTSLTMVARKLFSALVVVRTLPK